ncbi:MAG: hypothetical protein WCE68_10800 [Anaerolineales bacterium]
MQAALAAFLRAGSAQKPAGFVGKGAYNENSLANWVFLIAIPIKKLEGKNNFFLITPA